MVTSIFRKSGIFYSLRSKFIKANTIVFILSCPLFCPQCDSVMRSFADTLDEHSCWGSIANKGMNDASKSV